MSLGTTGKDSVDPINMKNKVTFLTAPNPDDIQIVE